MDKGTKVFRVWVLKIMEERKISQNKVALEADVSPQSISRWVTGRSSPTLRDVAKIADAYDCHIEIVPNEGGSK